MTRRAGTYLRISEDRTQDQLGVDRQRDETRARIAQRGWAFVQEFVDNDISARGRKRRPGFEALLAAVAAGEIDTIVTTEMTRLSRNRRDDLRIVELCMPRSVLIAITRGSDIDMGTASGRLFADLMASVARHEIEQKSERHKSQIAQAIKAGRPTGAPRAFGYQRNGLDIEPSERAAVAAIFDQAAAGAALASIAYWLRVNGYQTPRGNPWRAETVRVVLLNPRYAGLRGHRRLIDPDRGIYARYPDVVGEAVWPAIVSREVWFAVRERLTANRLPAHAPPAGPAMKHLLSQIALCGRCGFHVVASSRASTSASGPVRTYRCSRLRHLSRRADVIERHVERTVVKRMVQPDAVALLPSSRDDTDLAGAQKELALRRERLRALSSAWADGALTADQVATASARLRSTIGDLEATIAAAGQVDALAPIVLAGDYDAGWAAWDGYPLGVKREIIARVVQVTLLPVSPGRSAAGRPLDPDSVQFSWLTPQQ